MDRNRFFRNNYNSGIDYNSITNLEELRSARERLKNIIALKEYELEGDVNALKESLNPVTYINRLLTKIYSFEYLLKYFMKGYDLVRGWFSAKDNYGRNADVGIDKSDAVDPEGMDEGEDGQMKE